MSKEMRKQIDKVKNWKQFLNENTKNTEGIFTDAVWYNHEDGNMVLKVTGNKVYGYCDNFDFERDSKEDAYNQLKKWGFKYIGVD